MSAVDGVFYLGADAAQPRIGDLRISYTVTPAGPVSIVGRQSGVDFAPYQTQAGDRLLMVKPGTISAADMFKEANREAAILTWVLRFIGALVMFVGFALMLNPLVVVADVVPFIGNVLGAGASLVSLIADGDPGAAGDRDRVAVVPAAGVDHRARGRSGGGLRLAGDGPRSKAATRAGGRALTRRIASRSTRRLAIRYSLFAVAAAAAPARRRSPG